MAALDPKPPMGIEGSSPPKGSLAGKADAQLGEKIRLPPIGARWVDGIAPRGAYKKLIIP